ncbi:diguanylate cyclase domain-containing protein [Actinoplanes sp. NPDC049681]|uniref:diguanylate cyclase domain-containing protein n=1 Tax=Actinoplanes sp. NPDC049681 TaxID=3363905 RepID=UPI0037BB6DA7
MSSRGYAVASLALIGAYLALPALLRPIPFLLVTFAAVPAVGRILFRSERGARLPWWLLMTALGVLNAGNVAYVWSTYLSGGVSADDPVSAVLYALGYLILLVAAVAIVVRRGRGDIGGVIDAAITSLALGGVLWEVVFLPFRAAADATAGDQAIMFLDVFVMMGILGALVRVALVSPQRLVAVWLFAAGLATCMVANAVLVATADPVTGVFPDWANVPFLLAYVCIGCAVLHPSATAITEPGPAPEDDLTTGRLMFLGLMMALVPVVGGGRVILGLPADGVLIAVGSAVLIPLVMLRVARLATQRRQAERELRRLATADPLTGLPNRAACLQRLTDELAAGAGRTGLAVIFCDLDGFKPVNDRLGHAAGDELLIAVADRLRGCVRENDLVSRFGGDEFVIVCRDHDPRRAVELICDRVGAMVREPFRAAGERVRIGVSAGAALACPAATTDDLINRADLAMYEAKRSKSLGALSLTVA